MTKPIKSESVAFLTVLGILGVLLTVVGALLAVRDHLFMSNFCVTIGAAILGAAFSLFMARVFEPSQMAQLLSLIATSRSGSLLYDDRRLEPFREKYHGYIRSFSDGRPTWRYRIFDFSKAHTPGHLHAAVDVVLPAGTVKQFHYDGYVCEQHLLLIGRPKMGSEPPIVHVFPNGCDLQLNEIAGLAFVKSFDGVQLVAPSLLSSMPLAGLTQPGAVPEENGIELLRIWERHFLSSNKLNIHVDDGLQSGSA